MQRMYPIERGNDEIAFYLRESGGKYAWEHIAAVYIKDRLCPAGCRLSFSSYKQILQHIRQHGTEEAYNNVCFAIAQQCVILEANRGLHSDTDKIMDRKRQRRAIALYKLNCEFGLHICLVTELFGQSEAVTRTMAAKGMLLEKRNAVPQWLVNVLQRIEEEKGD